MVRVQDPPRQGCIAPGQAAVFQVCPVDGAEKPGADDVLALGAQIHGEGGLEEGLVFFTRFGPVGHDLRGQGAGGPGVHDVLLGCEAAGLVTLGFVEALGHIGAGVDGEPVLRWGDGVGVVGLPILGHRVPEGEGDAEEALTGNQPVTVQTLHPIAVSDPHEVGVEVKLPAPFQELLVELLVGAAITEVPLA